LGNALTLRGRNCLKEKMVEIKNHGSGRSE
jgi:hypothetical protein